MLYDTAILGGGPAGLAAALNLGRARKRVLLLDGGPRRNAAAVHVHGFVTRDGVTPNDFRALARAELAPYGTEFRDQRVTALDGEAGQLVLQAGGEIRARSVLLALGMVDETLPIPGFDRFWGHSIFQCPFCHGWEIKEQPFGVYLPPGSPAAMLAHYAVMISSWSDDVVAFASGIDLDAESRGKLEARGIRIEPRPIVALEGEGTQLETVVVEGGERIRRHALFCRPPQRQTALVASLGLALDPMGYVVVDDFMRTSRAGIYAAGDLVTPMQAAINAAALAARACGALVHELTAAEPRVAAAARETPPG